MNANPLKLTLAQLRFLQHLCQVGESQIPGGYPTAGRDASNWFRTVAVLEKKGLVTGDRGYETAYVLKKHGFGHQERKTLVPRTWGSPRSVTITLPAPSWLESLADRCKNR